MRTPPAEAKGLILKTKVLKVGHGYTIVIVQLTLIYTSFRQGTWPQKIRVGPVIR